jgi:hypothetical protein
MQTLQQSEREKWVPAFSKLGLSRDQVMQLSETEFINRRDYLEFEGFQAGPLPPTDDAKIEAVMLQALKNRIKMRKERPGPRAPLPALRPAPTPTLLTQEQALAAVQTRNLQREQDQEYAEAVKQVQKAQDDHQNAIQEARNRILEVASRLPQEPADGALLAIVLPSQKRIMRKFAKESKGAVVVDWAAANEELLGAGDSLPLAFEVRQATGKVVIPDQSLVEQGIVGRTLLTVCVLKSQ